MPLYCPIEAFSLASSWTEKDLGVSSASAAFVSNKFSQS